MARPLRIQYPGAVYHITNRGNDKKPIFRDDADRTRFLEILAQSVDIYQVVVHSFVMMSNHYHLLVETPLGDLAEFMRHFNITYTSHFNRRHHRVGHLFQGRYKSVLVDKDTYLAAVSKYIHLNPVKIRQMATKPLSEKLAYLAGYQWSSLPGFLNLRKRYPFVEHGLTLAFFGGDTASGRKKHLAQLKGDLANGLPIKAQVIGQSILGSQTFIAWVKENFLEALKDREQPAARKVHSYIARDQIIAQIEAATGQSGDEILRNRGEVRQLAMDLLYRFGGMNNQEIGKLMGIDYSTVSQGRKRLPEKREKNKELAALQKKIEEALSRIKI